MTPLIMTSPSTLASLLPCPSLPRRNDDACDVGASRIEIDSAPAAVDAPAEDEYVGGSIHVELILS